MELWNSFLRALNASMMETTPPMIIALRKTQKIWMKSKYRRSEVFVGPGKSPEPVISPMAQ